MSMNRVPVAPRSDRSVLVRPGDGLQTAIGQLGTIHKLPSDVVEGRVTVIEHILPPGRLALPLHRHSREDELSFVLAGQMGALLGDEVMLAGPDEYLLKLRGQWHAVWNAGADELRFLELIVPGGLESFLETLSSMLSGVTDAGAIAVAGSEYGIEFDFDGASQFGQRFGVTLERWPSN